MAQLACGGVVQCSDCETWKDLCAEFSDFLDDDEMVIVIVGRDVTKRGIGGRPSKDDPLPSN